MKKTVSFFAMTAVVAGMFSACGSYTTTATLTTELDSLNYAYGVANGSDIKQYILAGDSTKEAAQSLVKGFEEGFSEKKPSDRIYTEGMSIGSNIKEQLKEGHLFGDSTIKADEKKIFSTIYDVIEGKHKGMTADEAQGYFMSVMGSLRGMAHEPFTQARVDSLNLAFGVANGFGIKNYVLKTDSTEGASLVKGIKKGAENKDEKQKFYLSGLQIGTNVYKQLSTGEGLVGDSLIEAKFDIIKAGVAAAILSDTTQMTPAFAKNYYQEKIQKHQAAQLEKKYGPNREAGVAFLAENAKRPEVTTTASGLQYVVVKAGKGAKPTATDRVKVDYVGKLIDGTTFDSSIERGEPAVFGVTQVIPGWTEALQLMPVGSKWTLYVPQELAYGSRDGGSIPPFSTLVFEVELHSIEPAVAATPAHVK